MFCSQHLPSSVQDLALTPMGDKQGMLLSLGNDITAPDGQHWRKCWTVERSVGDAQKRKSWMREVKEGFLEEVGYELDLEIPAGFGGAGHSVTWEWARHAQVQGID